MHASRLLVVSICGLALAMAGCLERKERITIREDLSASIECEYSGDANDLTEGDAMPSERTGWMAFIKPEDDNKATLTATIEIAPGAALPGTFAAGPDSVALQFPTGLTKEERADATYYHFRRVYQHRDDARYTWVKRSLEQDSRNYELMHSDVEALSDDDRAKLIDRVRQIETDKELQFVEAGIAALKSRPQDTGLHIRMAVVKAGEAFDTEAAKALLTQPASPERDRAINAAAERYLQSLRDAKDAALRAERLTPAEIQAFNDAETRDRAARMVTEDLQDEVWQVKVTMPGEIVAHNATEADGGTATWDFDGPAVMDRDHILMVTSRVAKKNR